MDLFKETYRWTLDSCVEWNLWARQFSDMTGKNFLDFVKRTHDVVYGYLQGEKSLDGTCSDLECNLALEAKKVFEAYL
jgi:hypothetical protein